MSRSRNSRDSHPMTSMPGILGDSEPYRQKRDRTRSRSPHFGGLTETAENPSVPNEPVAMPTVTNTTTTIPNVETSTFANPITCPTVSIPAVSNPTVENPTISMQTVTKPTLENLADLNSPVAEPKEWNMKLHHILIKHSLSSRPIDRNDKPVTRTEFDAMILISEIYERITHNYATFAQAVASYSECKSIEINGGEIASQLLRHRFHRTYEEVISAMGPGEMSDIVETSAGFHLLYRPE